MGFRAGLSNYLSQRDRAWVLSLLAAVCLVYLPFIGSPFVFDDLTSFTDERLERYAHSLFHLDFSAVPYVRWLPHANLGWIYAVFGDVNTYFFRLGNLLLHAANVILLFYLLRQLAGAVAPEPADSRPVVWGAWFGALIFAVHPVAVYAAGYAIQHTILMATLFTLVMQLAYVKGMLTGQKRWLALAVAAYFLAGFSKEHSVAMPAVLVAITILLRTKNRLGRRAFWSCWLAFAAIALLVVLESSRGLLGTAYEPISSYLFEQQGVEESAPMLHLLSVLTQAGLFFKYLLLWWLPNPAWMSIDMREPFVDSLSAWQGWAGALGFVAYGALGAMLLFRSRWMGLAGLALLYPWLLFVVEFSSVRVQELFVLYRSYLWLPGMMLFFPLLLARLPGRRTMLALGLAALLLLPLAWNRLWVLADNYRLWNDAALLLTSEKAGGAVRIFYNRGQSSAAKRDWEGAAADFERAMALSPELPQIRKELGVAYFNLGRYQEAIAQFDTAIALKPEFAVAYYNKGMALKMLNQDDLAMQQMKKSCELRHTMGCLIVKVAPPKK